VIDLCCRILAKPECTETILSTVEWTNISCLSSRHWTCHQKCTLHHCKAVFVC